MRLEWKRNHVRVALVSQRIGIPRIRNPLWAISAGCGASCSLGLRQPITALLPGM